MCKRREKYLELIYIPQIILSNHFNKKVMYFFLGIHPDLKNLLPVTTTLFLSGTNNGKVTLVMP